MKRLQNRWYLNDGWRFRDTYTDEMKEVSYDDSEMEQVRLPHTCKVLPYHYFNVDDYQMICCYRNTFQVPAEREGQIALLTFEGAAHEATVYVNGRQVAVHRCGYTAFTVDITNYIDYENENTVVVRLDTREDLNQPPFGHVIDYMTYGGIYREVYLEFKQKAYLKSTFVSTDHVCEENKNLNCEVQITGAGPDHTYEIALQMRDLDNTLRLDLGQDREPFGDTVRSVIKRKVAGVKLWDCEHPNLYELTVTLLQDGNPIDQNKIRFGFRETEFRADGFYLNQRKLKLRGINRHQSFPYVGYAMPASMQRMDAEIVHDELKFNAVRTSHYPQSQYFLDRCDELGLLVFTEIPGWQHVGDKEWKKIACENVEEMIVQNRNHPSVILWGVRVNESRDDDEFYQKTNDIAHRLDSTRQTGGVRYLKKSSFLEDVYTYNDFLYDGTAGVIEKKSRVTSDKKRGYLISEYNGHMFPTKTFDTEEHRLEHALRHASVVSAYYAAPDVAGGFGWCLFDYNTHKDFGSGDGICYHGITDMYRNPKLAASVYQSFGEEDILTISSSMDIGEHPAGRIGDIYAFTNADSIRVYKNDIFLREFVCENPDPKFKGLTHPPVLIDDMIGNQLVEKEGYSVTKSEDVKRVLLDAARYGMYHIPFKTKLKALKLILFGHLKFSDAYNLYGKYVGDWGNTARSYRFEAVHNGNVVKNVVKEPVKRIRLQIQVDHTELVEQTSYDVAAIRVRAVDQNGNVLAFYNDPVTFSVSGEIELIGPDITSLRGGYGGTYVKSVGKTGCGTLTITSATGQCITQEFQVRIEE